MPLDFALTAEQQAIRELAHEFAANEIRPIAARHDETEEFPYALVAKAQKLGLTPAAFLPEEYGGQGLDFLTELLLNEELHWGCAGIAVCIQSMGLAIAGIRSSGTEEQKKRGCRSSRIRTSSSSAVSASRNPIPDRTRCR